MMRRVIYDLARAWWTSIALGTLLVLALGIVAGVSAVYRFLAESGTIWDPTPPELLCQNWEVRATPTECVLRHAGWGYGPTGVVFVLVVWSLVALVLLIRGPRA